MKHVGSAVYALINTVLLALANSCHLPFTLWLTLEQIRTGWGGGTGIEMAALLPILFQMLSVPVLLSALVFFILPTRRRAPRGLTVATAALFFALLVQYGLFHLFAFC